MKPSKCLLSLAIASAISFSAVAGGTMPSLSSNDYRKGLSLFYDRNFDLFSVGINLQNNQWETGLSFSADIDELNGTTRHNNYHIGGILGARKQLNDNVYGTLGVSGAYTFITNKTPSMENGYVYGIYTGFEYDINSSFQAFVRVNPYSYDNLKEHEFFEMGHIGFTYFCS